MRSGPMWGSVRALPGCLSVAVLENGRVWKGESGGEWSQEACAEGLQQVE